MGKDIKIPDKFFAELLKWDVIEKFRVETDPNLIIAAEDHKIKPVGKRVPPEMPWIHIKQDIERHCTAFQVIADRFKFVPSRCMECWKVVVRPRNIYELFQCYEMMKSLNRVSKLGIEERHYVRGLYGCYFYNDSKKEGLECKKLVRDAVDEWVSPEVDVYLKRYCTEFEKAFGPTKEYKRPDSADEWEKRILDSADITGDIILGMPDYLLDHVQLKWMKFAWKFDPDFDAVMKVLGETLYDECQKY